MATTIKKIIVKQDPENADFITFAVYVNDPGVGEPVIVQDSYAKAESSDFVTNLTDLLTTTYADPDVGP